MAEANRIQAFRIRALQSLAVAGLLFGFSPAFADRASAAGVADSPWPMFQHDPQHTGRSQYVAPSRLSLKWRFQVRGLPASPAIGADGTIYLPTGNVIVGSVADQQGFLYAINPDGTLRWRFEFPPASNCVIVPTLTTPAVAADGTIYVHTQSGITTDGSGSHCTAGPSFLYAINPDGTQKWAYQLNNGAGVLADSDLSSPAIGADGTIYVTSADTGFYAINPNGSLKWVVSPELTSIGSSPAIGQDGTIYFNISDLYAYTPDGVPKWVAQINSSVPNDNSPAVGADGTIYACGRSPDLCRAVSPAGSIIWSFPLDGAKITPALSADGTIHLADRTNGLYAVNPDGSQRWHSLAEDGFGKVSHSPMLGADGKVYARDDAETFDGFIHVLNPDGTEIDAEPIPPLFGFGGELSSAIGSDGTLYVPQPRAGSGGYDPDGQYLAAYGEDPGGGPGPGPDGGDFLQLGGRGTQRLGKAVKVKASCDEACTATGTGKLVVMSKRRVFKLKKAEENIAAGERETLKLRIPDKARRAAQRSLADDGKAKAKITVEAINSVGSSETAKRAIKLTSR